MRLAAIVLGVAAAMLTGCGVTAIDRTYDDALIREVGTGSDALGRIVPTLQAQADLPGSFKDPRNDRATTLLFQGQLAKLTQDDLVRLAKTNRQSAKRFETVLGKLDSLATELRAARVDVGAHHGLSGGGKHFVDAWNEYLKVNAGRVRSMRRAFSDMRPLFNEFQSVLRAAYDTATLRSTAQFKKVKNRVFSDVTGRVTRMQTAMKQVASEGPADRKFAQLVNSNQEAQAIVKKVNERHPHGSLAEQFKAG